MRTLLILLSSVGLVVWSVSPQPMSKLKKEEITIVVSPEHPEIVEVRTAADEISSNKKIVKPDLPEVLKPVLQGHEPLPTNPKLITPVAEGRVPSDLSKKIFYASHDDHQFGRKTLDLSGLDLDGEDVMQALHSLDAETLRGVARLDLSRNRVWSLPARVWPLQLEYSLLELRLDHNRLNLADPINTQTTRFELTRLLSLEVSSVSAPEAAGSDHSVGSDSVFLDEECMDTEDEADEFSTDSDVQDDAEKRQLANYNPSSVPFAEHLQMSNYPKTMAGRFHGVTPIRRYSSPSSHRTEHEDVSQRPQLPLPPEASCSDQGSETLTLRPRPSASLSCDHLVKALTEHSRLETCSVRDLASWSQETLF